MSENQEVGTNSICKYCNFRFRRMYTPAKPEEYFDEEGNSVIAGEDNIIIINQCLITGMDLEGEETIECTHFRPRNDSKDKMSLLKHLDS